MASTGIIYRLVAVDAASRTFGQIGRAARSTDSIMGKLGKTAKIAGEALVGGLAAGLAESARQATEFQSEMTRISTQAGATAKDVRVLSDQVLKLGTTTQQGPQKLAESLYHLKSVGMDNVSAMKALKEAADLAAVGHADLEQTTNALAGAWRTGIKGATSFHEAVSTVNAIIGAGNMSMEQFNAAIGTGILPSAKEFGLSLKQVGAALALMTDEGISADSAATRLRMSFSLLGAPSGAAEKQLAKIGLTGLQLADAMRGKDGLIGAIQMLKDHLDASGLSASQQSQILSRAFGGGRSSSGILLMINNLDVLKKKQDQVNKSTGKFDDAVTMQRQTAEAQWKLLTSNLEVMSVRIGTKVLPPLTRFVQFLSETAMPAAARFGLSMRSLIPVDRIKQDIGTAKGMVDDFLTGLGVLDKKPAPKTGIDKFPTSILGPGTGAPHLGSGQTSPGGGPGKPLPPLPHGGSGSVGPIGGVQGPPLPTMPHGGSGSVAPLITPKAAPPKSAAEKLGETIRKAVTGGIAAVNWSKIGEQLGGALGTAFQWVAKNAGKLGEQLAKALGGLDWVDIGKQVGGHAFGFAIGFISSLGADLFSPDFWKKHWWDAVVAALSFVGVGKIAGPLGKIISKIPVLRMFEPLIGKIGKLTKPFSDAFDKLMGFIGRHLGKGFARVFPDAAAFIEREGGLLTTRLGVWGLDLLEKGKNAAKLLGNGIRDGAGWVIAKIGELISYTLKPFVKVGGWLYGKGKDLIRGFLSGASDVLNGIGGWMKGHLVDPVVNWVKSLFGIHSPSTVFASIGSDLISGFKVGLSGAAKGIGGWVWGTVGAPAVGAFSNAGSWLWGKGRSFVGGLTGGIANRAKGIGGWVWGTVAGPSIGAFKNAGTWLWSKGGALISGFKSGIGGTMKGIDGWIKSTIVDPVVGAVKRFFGIKSPSRVFMSIGGHLVSGLIKGMARTNGTAIAQRVFGSMPKALAAIAKKGLVSISSLPGKALKALGGLGSDLLGALGIGGGGGGGGVNRWSGLVASVLSMLGAPAYAQGAVLRRIEIESGGNPNAINLTDINAKAGHPSQGLMQTIPSTFAAYAGPFRSRGITDPLASIYAGVNYAMHRYGANWINVMTRPGGYAKGTRGAAKGLAWVGERGPELVNFKGGEDVLSHQQSMAFAKTHGIKLPGYASGTIDNAADRVRRDRQAVEDAKDALSRARRRHKGEAAAQKRLQAAEKELKAAEIALRNAQRSAKSSIANTIATGLQKTLATGTSSAIASAIKSLATKLLNSGHDWLAGYVQRQGGALESLAAKKASIQSQINAANQYASDQAGKINDFLNISGTSAADVRSLISQMVGQQKTASGFVALSGQLKARGASKELLQALSDAGPGSQLASILGAKDVTTQDIAKLNSLVKSGSSLATSFGKDMADLMYDSGAQAGKGFLAGLKAQEAALTKQMAKLAADLVKEIKKILKIKSPSQVFRDEVGKQVVLGMAHGIDLHGHLVGSAAQRLADTAAGVSMRRRYVPTAANGRNDGDQEEVWARLVAAIEASGSNVHVHFNDDRLRDLIDVQVKPKIKASEDRQAARAKVGRRG
ncbi:phage tail tape measure protein [Streptomyces sp. NPDC051104]|uniref:phage tail tape measure protein n=1 Tax=Streptomyces sp. NPDC051104 TaxID=3155044 RepID=UPI00343EEDD3